MAQLCEASVGQPVEVTLEFFDIDGVTPKDTTPTGKVMHPDGETVDSYTGGQVTHVGTGVYTFVFTPSTDGRWYIRGEGTGSLVAAQDGDYVYVPDSPFV